MMEPGLSKIDSLSALESTPGGEYGRWQSELTAAKKELDKWHRKARKIVKEFRAERMETSGIDPSMERRFNLFSANVNILSTALLNQVPKPTVNREFKDPQDDVGRVACRILERALEAHNGRNFASYNILKQVVQDMLVPGCTTSWHTYHAEIQVKTEEPTEEQLSIDPEAEALEYDEVVGEQVKDEYVYWEDLVWSPARTWEEVRWIARKIYMSRDELTKRFGEKLGKEVPLDYSPKKNEVRVETRNVIFQQATIYEIWDKPSEQVIWFSEHMDKLLDQKPDYLELDDFFPCPQFLVSTVSNGQYIPIPDYHYASDQYRELNEINTRMGLLVRACRVAGVYDKASPQLPSLLNNAAENTLVPVDQWAAFAEKGGIKGVVDWIPLDQIVLTLDQLLKNREDVKQQIYEITGMADIIRGTSKASETLGAQKIKAQYASMRIQDRQKNVVEYASTVFDIQAQLMRKHMSVEEIAKLAQVAFMGEDEQLVQAGMQLLKEPDFILRARVESDTLSDIDFQAEKQDRQEYMQVITNFLEKMMPAMGDPSIGPFLLQLLQFSLAGFKIGKKFEGELDRTFARMTQQMQQPQPSPEEQKMQQEMQLAQQEAELEAQKMQTEMGFKQQEAQLDQQAKMMELEFKKKELELEMQKLQMEMQMEEQKMGMEMQGQQAQMQLDQQVAQQNATTSMQMNQQKLQMGEQQNAQKLKQGEQQFKQSQAQAAAKPKLVGGSK